MRKHDLYLVAKSFYDREEAIAYSENLRARGEKTRISTKNRYTWPTYTVRYFAERNPNKRIGTTRTKSNGFLSVLAVAGLLLLLSRR